VVLKKGLNPKAISYRLSPFIWVTDIGESTAFVPHYCCGAEVANAVKLTY